MASMRSPTVSDLEPREAGLVRSDVEPREAGLVRRLLPPVGAAVAGVAVGTALIAVAFAASRSHEQWAMVFFWAGEVLSVLSVAAALMGTSLSSRSRLGLLLMQAAQQSFIRWMYSPLFFSFPDELQHWRTATDILATQHLFSPNPSLPISPSFPGLEELATALVTLSHAGLLSSGEAVVAVAHVALAGVVFSLYRRVTEDDRVASLAALLFAITPLHAGFDTTFSYEGPALFFGLVLLDLAVRERPRYLRGVEMLVAAASLCALVVTHHLTAVVIIFFLGVLGLLLVPDPAERRTSRRLAYFCLLGAGLLAAWILTEAPGVVSYLGQPLKNVVSGLEHGGKVRGTQSIPKNGAGSLQLIVADVLISCALVAGGGWLIWRQRPPAPRNRAGLLRVFALCALSYYVILVVRKFAPDGAELAGRLLTFVALFTAPTIAFALLNPPLRRASLRRLQVPVSMVAIGLIVAGNISSGWPAPWEFLPGRFYVAGFESGIDRQNMSAVTWIRDNLPPRQRIACDVAACDLLNAYTSQEPLNNAGYVFYAPRVTRPVLSVIRRREIQYILVDLRMSRQPPIVGSFFFENEVQSAEQQASVPVSALTKFAGYPGANLIYSSGTMQLYDVRALDHA